MAASVTFSVYNWVQHHGLIWGDQRLSIFSSSRANYFILSIPLPCVCQFTDLHSCQKFTWLCPLTQTIWLCLQVCLKECVNPNILPPHITLLHCCLKSKPTWQHPGKSESNILAVSSKYNCFDWGIFDPSAPLQQRMMCSLGSEVCMENVRRGLD